MTRKKKPTASLVRSSAAEYLAFVAASGTVFEDSELEEGAVLRSFRITVAGGKPYDTKRYNLSAINAAEEVSWDLAGGRATPVDHARRPLGSRVPLRTPIGERDADLRGEHRAEARVQLHASRSFAGVRAFARSPHDRAPNLAEAARSRTRMRRMGTAPSCGRRNSTEAESHWDSLCEDLNQTACPRSSGVEHVRPQSGHAKVYIASSRAQPVPKTNPGGGSPGGGSPPGRAGDHPEPFPRHHRLRPPRHGHLVAYGREHPRTANRSATRPASGVQRNTG
jgi:hypothetical protein